ncbi:hypothetical protein [Streptomyces calidiresistens]|nr:hypothetical protein [Streptomyces calidiresistens]
MEEEEEFPGYAARARRGRGLVIGSTRHDTDTPVVVLAVLR